MNQVNYLQILKKKLPYIAVITGIVVAIVMVITIFQPREYSSQVQVMVMPNNENLDAETAYKTSEYIAKTLGSVVPTVTFLDKVNKTEIADVSGIVSLDEADKRKAWNRAASVNVLPETGILKITTMASDRQSARDLASAVSYVLVENSEEYYGGNKNVAIRVVDTPLTSKYPVTPNIYANLLIGILGGFLGSYAFFVLAAQLSILFKSSKKESKQTEKEISSNTYVPKQGTLETMPEQYLASEINPENTKYNVLDPENFNKQ